MDVLEQFLTMPMVLFCLVIWVLVWVQRKAVELAFPHAKEHKFWREFLLPLGPSATGAIFAAFMKMYPFPEIFAGSLSGRVFCGVVCGMGSGLVYRIYKQFLANKLGKKPEEVSDSMTPPSL